MDKCRYCVDSRCDVEIYRLWWDGKNPGGTWISMLVVLACSLSVQHLVYLLVRHSIGFMVDYAYGMTWGGGGGERGVPWPEESIVWVVAPLVPLALLPSPHLLSLIAFVSVAAHALFLAKLCLYAMWMGDGVLATALSLIVTFQGLLMFPYVFLLQSVTTRCF